MSTGLLVFGLWILFCAVVVGGVLWVLSLMTEAEDEECPLGKDCKFKDKVIENNDEYEHTKEYYDTERNK
jgi:hypothetical protein